MKITEEVGSKYRFIILAGQRVAQLQKGAESRVEGLENEKKTTIAIHEMNANTLKFHKIDPDGAGEENSMADLLPPSDPEADSSESA